MDAGVLSRDLVPINVSVKVSFKQFTENVVRAETVGNVCRQIVPDSRCRVRVTIGGRNQMEIFLCPFRIDDNVQQTEVFLAVGGDVLSTRGRRVGLTSELCL